MVTFFASSGCPTTERLIILCFNRLDRFCLLRSFTNPQFHSISFLSHFYILHCLLDSPFFCFVSGFLCFFTLPARSVMLFTELFCRPVVSFVGHLFVLSLFLSLSH